MEVLGTWFQLLFQKLVGSSFEPWRIKQIENEEKGFSRPREQPEDGEVTSEAQEGNGNQGLMVCFQQQVPGLSKRDLGVLLDQVLGALCRWHAVGLGENKEKCGSFTSPFRHTINPFLVYFWLKKQTNKLQEESKEIHMLQQTRTCLWHPSVLIKELWNSPLPLPPPLLSYPRHHHRFHGNQQH